ncbi:MAG: hypothetical protein Q9164_002908 [Protoblastenia rupestris]
MVQGLQESNTAITVFADDDVFWPPTFSTYMLASFEDPKVGAAGGYCSLDWPSDLNYWDFISICYLERWNFEIAATAHVDGGIPCLSGRTFAVRTNIVQSQKFISDFTTENWLGRVSLLAADDDNFITRWMVNNDWKIVVQCAKEAQIDGLEYSFTDVNTAFRVFFLWLVFSKTVKQWPHFYRHPSDLKFLPVLFGFGYFHGLIKMYGLCTLHKTSWGGGRVLPVALSRGKSFESTIQDSGSTCRKIVSSAAEKTVNSAAKKSLRMKGASHLTKA